MISMYNHIGYQAYNVGDNDLLFGIEFLQELEQQANFDFLSANILDSTTKEPVFKPYEIFKLGAKSLGVIGVASQPQQPVEGIIVENPVQSARHYLEKIQPKVDYTVILASLQSADERLFTLQSDLEMDFLILATNYRYSHYLDKTRKGYLTRCGDEGKYLGLITAQLDDKRKALQDISKTKYQLAYTRRRLASFAQNAGDESLGEYYKDQPAMLRVVRNLQRSEKKFEQELETVINPLDFELIPLDESVRHDPWILKQINVHKAQPGR